MSDRPAYFEAIRQNACKRWDQLESDPELAGPWYQLFAQVQSPRHVLSELLQNADDAGATEASVCVDDGTFVFSHDGEDFKQEHFASLCRFGYSNKRALHTIGFRGIGFKSIFSLGDIVELHTPTLTVAFHRQRFTEPKWIDSSPASPGKTVVRVRIDDERRGREVQQNLQEWQDSPVSLLFFKNIRCLQIDGKEMRWASLGPGPVSDTEWMAMAGPDTKRYLIARSSVEHFPADSLAEIRRERMLGADQDTEFPPCKVEIVLGVSGRLYVVLPTGVKTALPFACNAPFIQDPARLKIKDPETSPTNRWLLERAGTLAAEVMLAWLEQRPMELIERAGAYALLPDVDLNDHSLDGVCAATVEESFRDRVDNTKHILTDAGDLTEVGQCVVVPDMLLEVWSADTVAGFLDAGGRPAFSKSVPRPDREKLLSWGAVEAISLNHFLNVLQRSHLPKPKTWGHLLCLWACVAPEIAKYSPAVNAKRVRIFPVQGKDDLYSAEEIVRLGEKRLLQSDKDWDFLANLLLVLNQNWIRFIADERRRADEQNDLGSQRKIHAAYSVFKAAGIDEASDVSKVMEKVASAFFAQKSVQIADCVQIAQIASKLGASVGPSFQFVTRNNYCRAVSSVIVFDPSGSLEDLLPESWCEEHFLHPRYFATFSSCTAEEWAQWITSGRSGLSKFAPLTKKTTSIYGRAKATEELERRGFAGTPYHAFVTRNYEIEDWNFDNALWKHWRNLGSDDDRIWVRLMDQVLALPGPSLASAMSAVIRQVSTTGSKRSIANAPLAPEWVLFFRDLPCFPDTRGFHRKPAELLRRTQETESLIDLEPFVHSRFDTEANRPLLELLGVRHTPTGPDRLLSCLRALAKSDAPPIHEVDKWYVRLDQMTDACSTDDLSNIAKALLEERLVLTETSGWASGSGVYMLADEDDVPGAAVVRRSVAHLSLWRKIGVIERPTADRAIAWLTSLPWNEPLPSDDLRRVKALLARHPARIWNECAGWINLVGEWVSTESLGFSLTMRSLVPWSHLHLGVKRRTADFQKLSTEILDVPPFSGLPTLASRLEERFNRPFGSLALPEWKAWIAQLAAALARICLDDKEEQSRVRTLAEQLARTEWQSAETLEIVPYLDGTPAGTARDVEVVWLDETLYVKNLANARLARLVPDRLARVFNRPDISGALSYCFGRSAAEIVEYMQENFDLAVVESNETEPAAVSLELEEETAFPQHLAGEEPALPDTHQTDESPALAGDPVFEPRPTEDLELPSYETPVFDEPAGAPPKPRPPSKPAKASIIERYALALGFRKVADEHYKHADGRWISRAPGETFSWTSGNGSGEIACYYWTKDHCLELEPLQIDAEVWSIVSKFPQNHAFLLSGGSGNVVEIGGEKLRAMCDKGDLILHPATYRLVLQNGKY